MGDIHQLFTITTNGAITFTGNTLGLSKENNTQNSGTAGSIGALVTTQTFLRVNTTWPFGTTLTYTEDSSSAYLQLPALSTIVKAYLIWGGSYITENQDFSANISDPIDFITPLGSNEIDTPFEQFTYDNSSPDQTLWFYMNVKEVTSLVSGLSAGSHLITCGKIVGTTDTVENNGNCAGWTLCVIYENPTMPSRNMSIYRGDDGTFVESGNSVQNSITGFETPASGTVNARILITTMEGDAEINGDQALVLPPGGDPNVPADFNALHGPRNPVNNFFASQINNDDGDTDTTGTFGSRNQYPGEEFAAVPDGQNMIGGRQGWDITNVDGNPTGSGNFDNAQTETYIRFSSSQDRYWVTGVGLQFDVNSPFIEGTKVVNKTFAVLNDILEYTITIKNTGTLDTNGGLTYATGGTKVTDIVPTGTVYQGDLTVKYNDNSDVNYNGDIPEIIIEDPIKAPTTEEPEPLYIIIKFSVKITSIPPSLLFENIADIDYTFVTAEEDFNPGHALAGPAITETKALNPPTVPNYSVTTALNTPVSGTVVGTSPSGLPLTYSQNSNPSHGFASVDSNGNWHYTPFVGFVGVDSFTVLVTDSNGQTAISTITITVLDKFACELSCECKFCNTNCPNNNCY